MLKKETQKLKLSLMTHKSNNSQQCWELKEWCQEVMDIHKSIDSETVDDCVQNASARDVLKFWRKSQVLHEINKNAIINCIYPNKLWFPHVLKGPGAEQ